ncbi:MAG TPA: hypothetical protein VFC44_03880 [Candidatus Saccharimonadales bacterium]|nr:hypothetical protein [Candidatus Saccharimonadales bacterium]
MASQRNGRFLEAADYVRKGAPPDSEHAQTSEAEIARQVRRLLKWSGQTGCLIPPNRFRALILVSNDTSEHTVYYDTDQNRAVKVTFPGEFGWKPTLEKGRWNLGVAAPLDYLRRWRLFNEVFGDDVRLEGVALSKGPVMALCSKVEPMSAVISQPWHEAADPNSPAPEDREIATFLRRLGCEPLPGPSAAGSELVTAWYYWTRFPTISSRPSLALYRLIC